MRNTGAILLILTGFVCFHTKLLALNHDSLKVMKPARHYFKTTIYTDFYGTGKRDLSGKNFVSNKLKTYQLNQFTLGFNAPVFTQDFYKKDSTKISNLHLLLTGSYASVSPDFEGVKTKHRLSKTSVGIRVIYNTGKKSIFYVELAPFMTQDNGYQYTQKYRFANTVLYNCTVSKYFSFRLGYTRSFIFGNRYHLPYIGFRVGRMDGVNFSVQFPRSITFNVPICKYVKTSLYTKPQGGLYSFANVDSIYYLNNDKSINFGRYEFIGGMRVDVYPASCFNFYLSAGFTTQNYIGFYSETFNRRNRGIYNSFYRENIDKSMYVNFGLVFKFGKVKSIYNNYNLYDAQDLNNTDADNISNGNPQIPAKQGKVKNVKPSDVQDLIDTQDFY
ncbi:MAG: hypothetical protein V4506_19110 [Bacteroidota bacterium]